MNDLDSLASALFPGIIFCFLFSSFVFFHFSCRHTWNWKKKKLPSVPCASFAICHLFDFFNWLLIVLDNCSSLSLALLAIPSLIWSPFVSASSLSACGGERGRNPLQVSSLFLKKTSKSSSSSLVSFHFLIACSFLEVQKK